MLGARDRGEYRDPDLGKEPFGPYARAFLESGDVPTSARPLDDREQALALLPDIWDLAWTKAHHQQQWGKPIMKRLSPREQLLVEVFAHLPVAVGESVLRDPRYALPVVTWLQDADQVVGVVVHHGEYVLGASLDLGGAYMVADGVVVRYERGVAMSFEDEDGFTDAARP
jgi:hypothetical protein